MAEMPSAIFANVSCMPTAHTPANKPVRMQINAQNNAHPLTLNQTKRKPKNPAATSTGAKKIISTPSKLDASRRVIMRALRTAFAESPGGGVFFREAKTRLARGPSYVRALIPHNAPQQRPRATGAICKQAGLAGSAGCGGSAPKVASLQSAPS